MSSSSTSSNSTTSASATHATSRLKEGTRKALARITSAQTRLPPGLYAGPAWRHPPRWHYGYAAYLDKPLEDPILHWAMKNQHLGDIWMSTGSGKYVEEFGQRFDPYYALSLATRYVAKKVLKQRDGYGRTAMDGPNRGVVVISLCNNYSKLRPEDPAVLKAAAAVKNLLGLEGNPKWYIDANSWPDDVE